MSLDLILVFALSAPPSADKLQSALDRQNIPIRVSPSTDLQKQSGFMPVDYGEKEAGFHVTQLTYSEFTADFPAAKLSNDAARAVVSFGFGGHFLECAAAFRVASVLVSEFGAQAFDTEWGNYMSLADIEATAAACDEQSKNRKAQRLSGVAASEPVPLAIAFVTIEVDGYSIERTHYASIPQLVAFLKAMPKLDGIGLTALAGTKDEQLTTAIKAIQAAGITARIAIVGNELFSR